MLVGFMETEKILVLGSIAYDFIMNFNGNMSDALSIDPEKKGFNVFVMPETKIKSFGGVAGNIGYNLSLLGANAGIITSVGQDFIDLGYEERIKKFPDVYFEGKVHADTHSASCYIVNDSNQNLINIFYKGAMTRGEEIHLKGFYSRDNVKIASISPDHYPAMIKWGNELKELDIPFLFDPGQGTPDFPSEGLYDLISKSFLLIGNEFEISIILKKLQFSMEKLLKLNPNVIITKGSKGSETFFQGNNFNIPICTPRTVEDPTGAGDGFRSGLLFALAKNLPIETACKVGSVIGSLVVETHGPQSQEYTMQTVRKRFEENFHEELQI
jgi:adenosine kinase